jgi:hypothetical protein
VPPPEVRAAAGHSTSSYLHIAVDDDGTPGESCLAIDDFARNGVLLCGVSD